MLEAKQKFEEILINNKYQENKDFLCKLIPELRLLTPELWHQTLISLNTTPSEALEVKIALLIHNIGLKEGKYYPGLCKFIVKRTLENLGYHHTFVDRVFYLIDTSNTLIDPDNLDNTYDLIMNRLETQYALALALDPKVIVNNVLKLNAIREQVLDRASSNLTK